MKVLQKQIKLTNITKYIKKNDMRWLCLVVPLFIGLILHFIVPVVFIINANPTAQLTYNHQKLTLEQQTVRSISLLNSQIIRTHIQRYQNIRNFLIRIFGQQNLYQNIIPEQIVLNNAYQIAQMVQNGTNISSIQYRSMWYAQGKNSINDLNQVQQFVYGQYLAVQPFIQAQFLNINNSTQQLIFKGLTLSANYLNQPIYFQYPSKFRSDFLNISTPTLDKFYNQTIYNYVNSNNTFQYSIFPQSSNGENQIVVCNVIFDSKDPVGVACFYVLATDVAVQLTQSLSLPNISYSTASYYLLTPVYPTFSLQNQYQPQIIFNFTDKTSGSISYPANTFLTLPTTMSKNLFIPNAGSNLGLKTMNYSLYITFDQGKSIYFLVPINVYNYNQIKQTILFLLVKYNYQSSQFNSAAKYSQIFRQLSIPSLIIIVVSTLISLIVLKCLLSSLDNQLFKVNSNCQFLLSGDLDLKIPEYQNTQELQPVYKNLRIINCLHKFSTPSYFHQAPQKKIIKLYKVMEIFKQLNYPKDIVLQNIADAYLMIGQIFRAIQLLTQSYQISVAEIQSVFKQKLSDILILKHKQNKKLSKKYRLHQLKLIARLFKLILMYSFMMIPPPQITFQKSKYTPQFNRSQLPLIMFNQSQKKLRKYFQIFKKLAYPTFVTSQTLFAYLFEARFQIQKKNFKAAKLIIKRFQRIMAEYGNDFQNFESNAKQDSPIKSYQQMKNNLSSYCKVSPQIMWSAYYFIQGLYYSEQEQITQINQMVYNFKKSIQTNTFTQDIHMRVVSQMIKVSYLFDLDQHKVMNLISSFTFFKQTFPLYHFYCKYGAQQTTKLQMLSRIRKGLQKQVVFLFDCSNKWINKLQDFRKWQKQSRDVSSKIFNLLQPSDRISILKVNSTIFVSACCNLIYKKGNQSLILKQLSNAIKIKHMSGKCKIIQGIRTAVNRVKLLQEKKYIIVFIKEYKQNPLSPRQPQKKKKKMSQSSSTIILGKFKSSNLISSPKIRKNTQVSPIHKQTVHSKADSNLNSFDQEEQFADNNSASFLQYYKNLRQQLLDIMLKPQISYLRIILVTSNAQNFKKRLNLNEVNFILQKQFRKRQFHNNNLLFVFQYQGFDQFQKVLKRKSMSRQFQTVLSMF